jgi:hypothetical protein
MVVKTSAQDKIPAHGFSPKKIMLHVQDEGRDELASDLKCCRTCVAVAASKP